MELDDRKIMILKAVIRNYMETGEPVGSRTISKLPDCRLSSATIRNEMCDLEDMGYLVQPHTSAGRIPSDQGYRFYVDEILKEKQAEVQELKDQMFQRVDRLELVLKRMARLIASNTNYAAMISGPSTHHAKIKLLQLSRMDEHRLLAVIVVEGNIISNRIIPAEIEVTDQELLNLNILLNTTLNGLTIHEISLDVMRQLKKDAGGHRELVEHILNGLSDAFSNDEDLQIYTSGATNVFKYPELAEGDSASRIIDTFEEKDRLRKLLREINAEESSGHNGIQVFIGDESPVPEMNDCSMVTANYDLGGGLRGTIGIVGPKRMNYEKVLSTLRTLMNQLDENFGRDEM
ncbi:MAG: heat-inducible transcriptional repressor HrcA [Stomatobaculum sp.]